jgi:hypothetical protein
VLQVRERVAAIEGADGRRIRRQVLDKVAEPSPAERPRANEPDVEVVVALEVGLQRSTMILDES